MYAQFLDPETRGDLMKLAGRPRETFRMPTDLWVRTIHAFALAYHLRRLNPEHLLRSLTPLYLGRTASWVNEAATYGAAQVEAELNALCERFEALKPDFADAWRGGRMPS